ncbi:hypothetical protein HPB51_003786 [Rhipicephalus microplus]|uniref:Tick transposon n=2 Tax=Rhipicephalus microplus TaxID=6941 RepID=A0A9J6DFA1_RHIMP|nr:hypothetical protein HPB51_003786 [Rhipicephalus microplus]
MVTSLREAGLKLLLSDKEGGFVVLPRSLYKEKAAAAILENFNEVKGVVPAKVKTRAVQLCEKAGLAKLAKSVKACKETCLSAFFSAKTHKELCPFRTIVSERGTWQREVGVFLQRFLGLLDVDDPYLIRAPVICINLLATATCRARLYAYSLKHSYLPPEVALLFGAMRPSEGHAKRMCRILRSEAWRQVRFYTDCLQFLNRNELPYPSAQKKFIEDLRLASQTADFLLRTMVTSLREAGLKLLLSDKEGGFVVLPRSLYKEKAAAAILENFNEVKGVVPAKVKTRAVQLCEKAGLAKLAKSVKACKETCLSAFFSAKTHKELCPFRTIVSERGTWQREVGVFLQRFLGLLDVDDPYLIRAPGSHAAA